jgi:C4-dicarboxylate-specific signal transduction histidine kinase
VGHALKEGVKSLGFAFLLLFRQWRPFWLLLKHAKKEGRLEETTEDREAELERIRREEEELEQAQRGCKVARLRVPSPLPSMAALLAASGRMLP